MGPTIVLTAAVPWDGTTARPQHFARGLAERGWNVLFVDAPVTWISPFRNRNLWQHLLPPRPTRDIPVNGSGRLRVLSPVAILPFGNRRRIVNRWNQRALALQIRAAAPGPYILLPMLPGSVDLIPTLQPLAVLYDCVDYHSQFGGLTRVETVDAMERELAQLSRTVFTTADQLQARMEQWHADVRLLPNAAETNHFETTATAPVHERLQAFKSPRVGYIGGIGAWIDQDFIVRLADARTDVQFVLIGPVETDVSVLKKRPNIHLLGLQPYAELPRFLAGFDAVLVPFRITDLANAVNPIKVYEYLAAGRQVIATPMHEVKKLADLVWIADNPEAGVAILNRILGGERKGTDSERQVFLLANSWSARVDKVDAELRKWVPQPLT